MKVKNPSKPLSASHSSETLKSEGPVDTNLQPNATSQLGMDAKAEMAPASVCHLTATNNGLPLAGRRKGGRPRKIKPSKLEDKVCTTTNDPVADEHEEIGTAMEVPTCSEIHTAEAVPNNVKSLLNEFPHNETAGTCPVPDCKAEDDVPLGCKRTRARPTKREIAVIENVVSEAIFVNEPGSPTQKLRSKKKHFLALEENSCSDVMVSPKEMEVSPTPESSARLDAIEKSNLQIDYQIPAKVFKPDVSLEAVSVASGDTGSGDVAEIGKLQGGDGEHLQTVPDKNSRQLSPRPVECDTDKQVERDGEHIQVNSGGNGVDLSPRSVEGGTVEQRHSDHQQALSDSCLSPQSVELQQPKEAEGLLPQISKQADQQTFGNHFYFNNSPKMLPVDDESYKDSECPRNCDNSKNAVSPQTPAPSGNDVPASSEEAPEPVEIPSVVKVENEEEPLDQLDPLSKSNNPSCSQQIAKMTSSSEGHYIEQSVLRRRKGRMRRRRITILLRQEDKVETQHETDCGDTNTEADQNISYTQKGSKTLLKCGVCSRTYKFMSQYVIHQRVHTGERPFECPECKRGFSKKSNLNLHLRTHVKNTLNKECTFCKVTFSDDKYYSHMKTHTKVQEREAVMLNAEDSPVETLQRALAPEKSESKVCQYCGKSFKFQSALIRHERVHTGEKPYKCDICGKAFGQSYFLRVHELTHWSVKRYNCTGCKKSFSHYSNAKNHTCRPPGGNSQMQPSDQVAKASLTYSCHICKNVLESLPKFNKHMRDHIGTKLYRCLYCDKLFGLLSEFHAHCSMCQGEKNGSCFAVKEEERMSVVEYTVSAHRFSSEQKSDSSPINGNCETYKRPPSQINCKNSNLVKPFQPTVTPTRLRSHFVSKLNKLDNRSDPRSYLCPSCGRLFRHIGRLRAHMLTHAPHQRYTCSCCGKMLQNWTKLWRHQRVHRQRRGRFTCTICGKGFRFVESYKKHMSEHPYFRWIQYKPKTVFLPYNCDQCTSRFKTLDLLFSHQICHFSAQVTRQDSVFDLSMDDHSPQSNSMLNPTTNHQSATLCHELGNNALVSSVPKGNALLGPTNQVLHPRDSPILTLNLSDQKQDFGLNKTAQSPRNTHRMQKKALSCHRKDGNVMKKQKGSLRTANRYSSPNKGASQSLICAMCGNEYTAVSDLYHHYLQHAQCQV
ncbi:zinc finger protein 484 isoform X2 [Phyllopteryx taeniolatus]|nr:zinc finger protein 484 isoform X2 [Phyllopteryx taeniolatus]